jgi:hypothetical protein
MAAQWPTMIRCAYTRCHSSRPWPLDAAHGIVCSMRRLAPLLVAVAGALAAALVAPSSSADAPLTAIVVTSAPPSAEVSAPGSTRVSPPSLEVSPPDTTRPESRTGFFVGPRVGGQLMMGQGIASVFTGAYSVGGEVNLRFADTLFVGVFVDHAFGNASVNGGEGPPPSASAAMTNVDAIFGVIVGHGPVRGLLQLGGGYRWAAISETDGPESLSFPYQAGEGLLGAGLWIQVGPYVRLIPRIDLTVGAMTDDQGRTDRYTLASAGLAGDFNLDFR